MIKPPAHKLNLATNIKVFRIVNFSTLLKRCFSKTTALFLLTNILFISPATALEELKYSSINDYSPSLYLQLESFLKKEFKSNASDYLIANTDLNGDNLDEHILKRKNCGKYTNICTFIIVVEKNGKPTLLSKINAQRLMVGNDENYGIKNLLAFKNPKNAYDFDIYMWSPDKKMYILAIGKTRN